MTGFTTDQEDIPDYGSVESGHLENAKYAQYTSTEDTDTQLVDEDGRFVLEAGETVTFSDQFRRGSYISLNEELNKNLYDTTWTVYENGQKVTSMSGRRWCRRRVCFRYSYYPFDHHSVLYFPFGHHWGCFPSARLTKVLY